MAAWCRGTVAPAPTTRAPQAEPEPDAKKLKDTLWNLTRGIHNVPKGCKVKEDIAAGGRALAQWLLDEGFLGEEEQLADLSTERLQNVVQRVTERMNAQ
jgi:hypothetical protein